MTPTEWTHRSGLRTRKVIRMKIERTTNDYGTPVTKFWCDTCGAEYTVCPAPKPDMEYAYQNCMSPECDSYDPSRDADNLFNGGAQEREVFRVQKRSEYDQ